MWPMGFLFYFNFHIVFIDPSKYTTKQNEESIGIGDEQNHKESSRQTTSSLKEEKLDVKSLRGELCFAIC